LLSVRKLVADGGFNVNFTPSGNCNITRGDVQVATAALSIRIKYVLPIRIIYR